MGVESLAMADTPVPATGVQLSELALLVQRAQGGDSAAFDALHGRFAASVHGLRLARLSGPDVDDALQETFVLAWKRLATLRDADAIGPWLHAIARHAATDRLREPRASAALPPGLSARVEGSNPERDELRGRVLAHLRSLPEAYKETLAMRLVEGLTGPEIAAATGLSEGSVRVNLCRGMARLRELLEKEGWP